MNRTFFELIVLIGFLLVVIGASEGNIITVDNDWSGADFSSIQEAIDDSTTGDVIQINSGGFNESIEISIPLEIRGNGTAKTIIYGAGDVSGEGSCIKVSANNSHIKGLTVQGIADADHPISGIWFDGSSNSSIEDVEIIGTESSGLRLIECSSVMIVNLSVKGINDNGLHLLGSTSISLDNVTIVSNRSQNGSHALCTIDDCRDIAIKNSEFEGSNMGIWVGSTINCSFNSCIFKNNTRSGALLNTVSGCVFTDSVWIGEQSTGLDTGYNKEVTVVRNCLFKGQMRGIHIGWTSEPVIIENNIMNCTISIEIDGGISHRICNNSFVNGGLHGGFPSERARTYTIKNNTVEGKPLLYIVDETDLTITEDAGQIFIIGSENVKVNGKKNDLSLWRCSLIESMNCTIKNVEINGDVYGLKLTECHNSIIENVTIADIYKPYSFIMSHSSMIDLFGCNHTSVTNVVLDGDGKYGIRLSGSENTSISSAMVSGVAVGVYARYGWNNRLDRSCLVDNEYGLSVQYANNVRITGSTFRNRLRNVVARDSGTIKLFNNDFLLSNQTHIDVYESDIILNNMTTGNYYYEYTGQDLDGDGVGDTPYEFGRDLIDEIPSHNRIHGPNEPPRISFTPDGTWDEALIKLKTMRLHDSIRVEGSAYDNDSLVQEIQISVNYDDWEKEDSGSMWSFDIPGHVRIEGRHEFRDLIIGNNTVRVRAYDGAEYSEVLELEFTVTDNTSSTPESDQDDDQADSLIFVSLLAISLLLLIIIDRKVLK